MVLSVTASYSGSSRRSKAARLVCILRAISALEKFVSFIHGGFHLSGENALDGGRGNFLADALSPSQLSKDDPIFFLFMTLLLSSV